MVQARREAFRGSVRMAIITYYNIGIDMTSADSVVTAAQGDVTFSSSTEVDFASGFYELDVHGKNFGDFDVNEVPHSGTIKGFDLFGFGSPLASFSKMHLDVADFDNYVATNDASGLISAVLAGNDKITGSTQGDVLTGLTGRDQIDGSSGNDVIIGGMGGDQLTGGDGADTFVFSSVKESSKLGVDVILDLEASDTIDLSAIDADTHTKGDQAFHIVSKLKGHAGEMTVTYDSTHDRTILSMDNNGDGTADGIIWINGDHRDFGGLTL
jgi:Ca2+-binding RTX toxin-like protein